MLRIDVQGLTATVFNRLASDSAGAPVRALLTAGAGGVIPARQLDQITLPPGLFVALRRQSVTGPPGGPHEAAYVWHVFDDDAQGYYRINGLLLPLAQAYDHETNPLPITVAPISHVDVEAGEERVDSALKRPVVLVTLRVTC